MAPRRVAKHITEEAYDLRIDFVEQPVQRGTADAAALGLSALDSDVDDEDVLVVSADMPLIQGSTLRGMTAQHRLSGSAATAATAGEESAEIYCFRRSLLSPALRRLTASDSGREYNLFDAAEVLTSAGHDLGSFAIDDSEAQGVDDREQLAFAEAEMRPAHQPQLDGRRRAHHGPPQRLYRRQREAGPRRGDPPRCGAQRPDRGG